MICKCGNRLVMDGSQWWHEWGTLACGATPASQAEIDNDCVASFAAAMRRKLAKKRNEGRAGWHDPRQCSPERLARMLVDHVPKGDPVDVANFAMMLYHRQGGEDALREAVRAASRNTGGPDLFDEVQEERRSTTTAWPTGGDDGTPT